jgi:hypothetical protein
MFWQRGAFLAWETSGKVGTASLEWGAMLERKTVRGIWHSPVSWCPIYHHHSILFDCSFRTGFQCLWRVWKYGVGMLHSLIVNCIFSALLL